MHNIIRNSHTCSTWNKLKKITTLFYVLLIFNMAACKKTHDPKPELKDQIYQDYLSQQSEIDKNIAEVSSKIDEIKKNIQDSKPQTGAVKRNIKIFYDLTNLKDKYSQQQKYWKVRSFERLKHVRQIATNFDESALKEKLEKEFELYSSEKKLRVSKKSWDLKQRFKESGFTYDPLLLGEESKKEIIQNKPAGH